MPKSDMPKVTIYSDGSCEPNPGPGGWAALLQSGNREKELHGSERNTTNNRMELTAALRALEQLKRASRVDFYTDSEYLRKGITEWMPRWKERDWRRKGGALANVDLWQALDKTIQSHKITWHWVRSHTGNPGNERVDRLARQSIPKD